MKTDYRVGERVILDGNTPAVVTKTSVYVGRMQTRRQMGVSVRPLPAGRARVVSFERLTLDEGA